VFHNLSIKFEINCFLLVFYLFLFFLAPNSHAQLTGLPGTEKTNDKTKPKQPIHIKSDVMESENDTGNVIFTGNVVVTYNDITINTDKMDVVYIKTNPDKIDNKNKNNNKENTEKNENKEPKKNIDKLIATGNVKITQGKKIITGNKAVYEKGPEKITITGDAQAWDDKNRIKGETIIYYVKEERSVVQGKGKDKVEAIVYPSE